MENELIKVTVKNDQQLVSARDLYKGLGIKRRFSAWWEQSSDGFEENSDFTSVLISTVVNNGAIREVQDYDLTIDMAKQLCLMSRTEKGKQCLLKILQRFTVQLSNVLMNLLIVIENDLKMEST